MLSKIAFLLGNVIRLATLNSQTQKNECIQERKRPIYPHTHSYTETVTAPTCTEEEYTVYACTCGSTYTDNVVAAKGHTEVIVADKAATCTETGLTEGKQCSVCGTIIVQQKTIPAKGHSYENGFCSECGSESPNLLWGDADGNGRIQTNDAKLILQYCAEMIDKFPVEE